MGYELVKLVKLGWIGVDLARRVGTNRPGGTRVVVLVWLGQVRGGTICHPALASFFGLVSTRSKPTTSNFPRP